MQFWCPSIVCLDKVGLLTIRYVKNIKLIWLVKYLLSQISWRKKFCTVLPFFIQNQQCRFLWPVCLFYFRVLRPVFIKRDKTKGPNSSLWYLIMKNCQLAWKIIQKIMRTSWSNNIRKCAFLQWTSVFSRFKTMLLILPVHSWCAPVFNLQDISCRKTTTRKTD